MTSSVQKVKEELAHVRAPRRCCQIAELSALLHADGTYRIRGSEGHSLVTESAGVNTARKVYTLIHSLFEVETSLLKVERNSPRRGNVYRLEMSEQPGFHQILNELGVLDSTLSPETTVPRRITRNDCCASAALRGAFLGGGYASEPYRPADFEITFSTRYAALAFMELLGRKSLKPGIRQRRNQWVLYLKSRSQISEFFALAGAHQACLEWQSQSIINSTKSTVNRLVNCDAANAKRLAESSIRQREAIRVLRSSGLLRRLDPALIEMADARERNPQASLAELGQMLDPPVSKAIVQSRMRRLTSVVKPVHAPGRETPWG